jgi:hypothetical protein
VNIDAAASTQFGDADGLRQFNLVHRFVHEQTGAALTKKFAVPVNVYGVDDPTALGAWIAAMRSGQKGQPVPLALQDWLFLHSQIHVNTYVLLGQSITGAPDLSQVDFGDEQAFNDWMYAHQQMHDYEQQQLGLT